jgi:DNA-binding transcriptional regulator of glucitol operon
VQRLFGSRALAIVAVSLVAVVGGLLLAWWQWNRYQSATGTLQNLGYVLQWPLFGVFPAFMFWRIHRTARRERDHDAVREQPEEDSTAPDPRLTYVQNRTVAGEDQELLAYNEYLATLADREQRHAG